MTFPARPRHRWVFALVGIVALCAAAWLVAAPATYTGTSSDLPPGTTITRSYDVL